MVWRRWRTAPSVRVIRCSTLNRGLILRRRLQDLLKGLTVFGDDGGTEGHGIRFDALHTKAHQRGQAGGGYPLPAGRIVLPCGNGVESAGFLQQSFIELQGLVQRPCAVLPRIVGQQSTQSIGLGQQAKDQTDLWLHSGLSAAKGRVQLVDSGQKTVVELVEMFRGWEFVGKRSRCSLRFV